MEGLGAKLTISQLLIRVIAYIINIIRPKNPVVIKIDIYDNTKTEKIRIKIRANTVMEADVKKQRQVLLN
jgi:hypothetical protein